jgi:hypothetical protein
VRRNKLFPQKNTPADVAQKQRKKDLEMYFFLAHTQILVKCFDFDFTMPRAPYLDYRHKHFELDVRNLDDQSRARCPEATARNLDENPRAKRPVIHQTRAFPPLPPLVLRPAPQSGKRYAAHGHDHDFCWDVFAGTGS